MMQKNACTSTTADSNIVRSCEFSEAVSTANTHITPINGSETTDSQSSVLSLKTEKRLS